MVGLLFIVPDFRSSFAGLFSLKCGELAEAEKYLKEAIDLGKRINAYLVSPSLHLAQSYEVLHRFAEAEEYYQLLLAQSSNFVQHCFICGGHTGMGRMKYALHDYAALMPHWIEAERLARQFQYNDYCSSLFLLKKHIVWDNLIQNGKAVSMLLYTAIGRRSFTRSASTAFCWTKLRNHPHQILLHTEDETSFFG